MMELERKQVLAYGIFLDCNSIFILLEKILDKNVHFH